MAKRNAEAPKPPSPLGRPSDYSDELVAEICHRLANGQTLTNICKADAMPHHSTVFRWLDKHEAFRELYARAREYQAHYYADQIVDIADDGQGDVICDEYGNEKQNHEFVNRSKLRIDARKWHAAKSYPKKYGDKPDETESEKVTPGFEVSLDAPS